MSAIPCWTTRKEVLGEDAIYDLIPDCEAEGHTHGEDPDAGWDGPGATCRWNWVHGICDLDAGHAGPHEFVAEDEIVLVFK
jgi:hypothetical protein